jgi:predicted metal-dependent peptidase
MVSKKIASFPIEKHSEWYFNELMNDEEVKKAIESSEAMGRKSLSQALADGDVTFDENGDLVDRDGNSVTVTPGSGGDQSSMDNHEGWGQLTEEQKDIVKGKIKQALEDSIKKCDGSNSWGSIPSSMQKKLRKMVSKEIPWQSVLKQFCGLSRRADRTSNVRRLNRKYPGIHPGVHRSYKANIAIYVDQSGSVSDSDLELLSGELGSLANHVAFTLFNFDTEVDEKSEREIKKGKFVNIDRTRCGGTCFSCVQVHANKNAKRFDGYLILTDGYASNPKGFNKLKRGWVITPGGQLQFPKSGRDFLIAMKDKNTPFEFKTRDPLDPGAAGIVHTDVLNASFPEKYPDRKCKVLFVYSPSGYPA